MLEIKRGNYSLEEKKKELPKKIDMAIRQEKAKDGTIDEEFKKEISEDVEKTTNEDIAMKGLGNFTFNGRKVVPNIQILADRVGRSNSNSTARWYSKVELFAMPNLASLDQNEYKANFFIPEFSTYGINYTFATCNVKTKDYDKAFVGFTFSTSFLDKSFKKDYDSLSIKKDFTMLNSLINIGAELVFPKTYTSIYGNINLSSVLTSRDTFLESMKTHDRDFLFFTGGIRSQLNLSGEDDKSNVLALDLGFIFQSNGISSFVNNNDFAIPLIRLNFRHSFLNR
ncbi:hypothetical protein GCM10028810_67570 [Spirosoma litoris]